MGVTTGRGGLGHDIVLAVQLAPGTAGSKVVGEQGGQMGHQEGEGCWDVGEVEEFCTYLGKDQGEHRPGTGLQRIKASAQSYLTGTSKEGASLCSHAPVLGSEGWPCTTAPPRRHDTRRRWHDAAFAQPTRLSHIKG